MKKKKLIELLKDAAYQPRAGDRLCRGSIQFNTGCGECPRCTWGEKRKQILTREDMKKWSKK